MPSKALIHLVDQWNVSPKLSNAGMPLEKRIRLPVLQKHVSLGNACFKFPVLDKSDLIEVQDICGQAEIPSRSVYLMPICSTRQEHIERAPQVVDWCKEFDYNFSPRLQILIFDQTCGV